MNGVKSYYFKSLIILMGSGAFLYYTISTYEQGNFSFIFFIKILACLFFITISIVMIIDTARGSANKGVVEKTIICENIVKSGRTSYRVKYREIDNNIEKISAYPLFSSVRFEVGKKYLIRVTSFANILIYAKELNDLND